ncbi:MAG TPA: glycosyl hydrolase family 28 protein [Chthonomonadaceae bacterium]|nr:glycosyl hydrolase family 28 protein [Chthonomonadaceae bacterium]
MPLKCLLIAGLLLLPACAAFAAGAVQDVRAYGAKGDGTTKDTAAVQAALDAAARQGGGDIVFPPGRYLCGTLHLKSHLTLRLLSGATLASSPDPADFDPYEKLPYETHSDRETSDFHLALLAGQNIEDVAIVGQGTIDGNRTRRGNRSDQGGPKPIALKNCQRITLRDITVRNAPNYAISFLGCDYVNVDGVSIRNGYADGIDPDCCRHVRIANCFVDSYDDAICLKASLALGVRRSTEHVTITNCVLTTSSNFFKMGTESSGDFKNIAVSNCVMFRRTHARDSAGLAIETVDGANIEGLTIANISMQDVFCPLFLRLGNRGRGLNPPTPGTLRDVSITHIVATGATMTCSLTGLPGHPVERVSVENMQVTMQGGATAASGLDVPELAEKYPESNMFGTLPAYDIYCRHVDGLTLRNLRLRTAQPDARPALICDDARDLELNGLQIETLASGQPAIWLHQSLGALVQGCRLGFPTAHFARVTGSATRDVRFLGNDLPHVAKPLEIGPEVSKSAITQR